MAKSGQLRNMKGEIIYPKTIGENVYIKGISLSGALDKQTSDVENMLLEHDNKISEQIETYNSSIKEEIDKLFEDQSLIIDEKISIKADKAIQINTNIPSSAWIGASAPYTASMAIDGITEYTIGDIGLMDTATSEQRESARSAIISPIESTTGYINLIADGDKPLIDLPIVVRILEWL